MPADRDHRRFWFAAGLGVLVFVALVLRPSTDNTHLAPLSGIALALANVTGIVLAARWVRPPAFFSRLLLGSSVLALAGTVIFWAPVLLDSGSPPGKPSWADVAWLAAGQCLTAALLVAMLRRERARFVLLDIVALTAGLGLVVGVLLIAPNFGETDAPVHQQVTQVAYVGFDVLLLSTALRALLSPGRPVAIVLLAVTVLGVVVSDFAWNGLTLSGTYVPGGWADLGWYVAPIVMVLAAVHPSARHVGDELAVERSRSHATGPILLTTSTVVLPAMIALQEFAGIPVDHHNSATPLALIIGGVGIGAVVGTRVLLYAREAERLAADLGTAITDRDRMLERTEARHHGLVEQLPACIYVLEIHADRRPTTMFVSSKAQQVTGLSEEVWLAGELIDHVHPDDRRALADEIRSAGSAQCQRSPFEFRVIGQDGVERWLRDAGAVSTVEDGVPVLRGVLFDVSDVRHAEAERAQMEMELGLSQKLDAVGQLAAGIAHEINTPIQFVGDTVRFLDDAFGDLAQLITAYEDLLAEARAGSVTPATVERVGEEREIADLDYLTERVPLAIKRAGDGVSRVATIVRAMRDFAHPGSVEKKPVDLNESLRNTLVVATNEYKYVAEVDTDLGELPAVTCSGSDLNQVFLNLLVNAAHAIADVANQTGERGRITVRTRADGDHVVVSIGDTGGGIPAAVAPRVFDPFFTTKAVGHGTGQGLAIARTIVVERHGGTMTFDTEAGVGTTFHLRLPVTGALAADAPAVAA